MSSLEEEMFMLNRKIKIPNFFPLCCPLDEFGLWIIQLRTNLRTFVRYVILALGVSVALDFVNVF